MFVVGLFAQQPNQPGGSPFPRAEILYAAGGLIVALLVGAVAAYFADRWKKRALADDRRHAAEELTGFREMFERGEVTEEEYTRLRDKVADRMARKPAAPAAPPTTNPGPAADRPPDSPNPG